MATIKIPPPRIPVIDQRSGAMSQPWYAFFAQFLQGANDGIDEGVVTAAALAVRVVTLEVEDGNLFIDHAMDVRPTAEIDGLRKRITELEVELSMSRSPLAAIEELRKRVADIETDLEMGL
jgi:folate-dependent phosphoribosylglycinamide formyltransferase PurN